MVQIIYGDVLLLIDFCMNFFVLYTTGILLRRKTKVMCLAGASIVGGIYSVAKVFVNGNDVFDCIISFGVGLLMCYITFGAYRYLKTTFVFFATSALVGGIMFGIYFLFGSYHSDLLGNIRSYAYSHIPLWLFTVLAAISFLLSWLFSYLGREAAETAEESVTVEHNGHRLELRLLLDSGNLAKEPISGKNVVLLWGEKVRDLLSEEIYDAIVKENCTVLLQNHFRLVSLCGIDGKKRISYGFFPDRIFFEKGGRYVELDACVAVCNYAGNENNIDGIAHPTLFA